MSSKNTTTPRHRSESKLLRSSVGWGVGLWLWGYVLGFVLFFIVPLHLLGWFITPFGVAATTWVLLQQTHFLSLKKYFSMGAIWTGLAIVLDYVFLVQLLKPADGYYKLDIYLYYGLTLLLPVVIGAWKLRRDSMKI